MVGCLRAIAEGRTPLWSDKAPHRRTPAVISSPPANIPQVSHKPSNSHGSASGTVVAACYPGNRFGLRVLGHLQDAICPSGHLGIVRHEDGRSSSQPVEHQVEDLVTAVGVKGARGLVSE